MPKWQITVPQSLYDAIADPLGEPYADSYLWGAVVRGSNLIPHTVTAWERLTQNFNAREAIKAQKLTIIKPAPWGSKGGSDRSSAELFELLPDPRKPRRPRPDHDAW